MNVVPSGELVTSEAGQSVELSISLSEPPPGPVTVRATSGDPSEGTVSAPVRFDASNWSTPQIIRVTGVDDAVEDGDVSYQVKLEAVGSSGALRHGVLIETLSFTNQDDDIARFTRLGDLPGGDVASYAAGLDQSGGVVVGWSRSALGDEATRWTPSTGLTGLGGSESQAHGVSPDGELIVGYVTDHDTHQAAAIWRGASQFELVPPIRYMGGPVQFDPVDANVVRDDGYIYGTCAEAYFQVICVGPAAGELSAGDMRQYFAADDAGHSVAVRYPGPHGGSYSSKAFQSGLLSYALDYPAGSICLEPHSCGSQARAFSVDPAVVVGTSQVPPVGQPTTNTDALPGPRPPLRETAFVASEGEGMLRLPDLDGGDESSGAYAIDAAGRVIGGFGTNADGTRAVVWVEREPKLLSDVVAAAGGSIPSGFVLNEVIGVSSNGRIIVGNGTSPDGNPEAFRVVLPCSL